MRHAGKVVVVTGGGRGQGRAIAHRFGSEGARRVYIIDRFQDRLDQVLAELTDGGIDAKAILADLSTLPECRRAITEAHDDAGRIDVLISNAGIARLDRFWEIDDDTWTEQIAVNLTAHFGVAQTAARFMMREGGGIINCTTSTAVNGGVDFLAHYNAAKAGLANLVQTMAIELVHYNIRVNAVSPGACDTPMGDELAGHELMDEFRKSYPAVPMGRLAQPEEIAAAHSFLASDEASYVTGVVFSVDGGIAAHFHTAPMSPEDEDAQARADQTVAAG